MKFKGIGLFLLVLLIFLTVSAVYSEDTGDIDLNNTVYVNNSYTGDLEDGSADHPFKTVQDGVANLINHSKSNIFIADGEYEINSALSFRNNTINIIGEYNVTLNAVGNSNIFTFTDGSYTISNIIFLNGRGLEKDDITYGGAIFINSSNADEFDPKAVEEPLVYTNVLIKNCVFYNNTAERGGAIFGNYSDTALEENLFSNNGGENGGALYLTNSHLLASNNEYYNNFANIGGVAYFINSLSVLDEELFDNNVADFGAGALFSNFGVLYIKDTVMSNNVAGTETVSGSAGALLVSDTVTEIENTKIFNNSVIGMGALGGAIVNVNVYALSLNNTIIANNTLKAVYGYGGAIYNKGFIYLEDSTIVDNVLNAKFDGEGVIFSMNGMLSAINSVIENNTVSVSNRTNGLVYLMRNPYVIGNIDFIDMELPEKYDLRNVTLSNGSSVSYVTPVKDQGRLGTCWAFSSIAALESSLMVIDGVAYNLSEINLKNLMSYTSAEGYDSDGNGGTYYYTTAYLSRWGGPVNETDDPYNISSTTSPDNLTKIKHVQDMIFIPLRTDFTDIDQVKKAILLYGGLAVMYDATDYVMHNISQNYSYKYFYEPIPSTIDHGVLLVGWDDNYPASNFDSRYGQPPADGAFIIKNSWGSKVGEEGYFYISYYDATIFSDSNSGFTMNVVEDTDNYKDIYYYDPLGATESFIGFNNETAWFKNRFISESDDPLSAFSIITSSPQSEYTAYIYLNNELVTTTNGTINEPGYHTIKLDKYVTLRTGDVFEIAVKLYTPGFYTPIAVQTRIDGLSSKATAELEHSYVSYDGEVWEDVAFNVPTIQFVSYGMGVSYLNNTAVCLKAFTAYTNETNISCQDYTGVYTNPGNLTGTLVDNQGNGVTNQTVSLLLTRLDTGLSKTYNVTTDENGNYYLPINLAPNQYTAEASFNGYNSLKYSDAPIINITVKKDNKTTTILTAEDYQQKYPGEGVLNKNFTGKLTLEDQTPLANQKVTLTLTRIASGASKAYTVTTDVNGNYYLPIGLAIGDYSVNCAYDGTDVYSSATTSAKLTITP